MPELGILDLLGLFGPLDARRAKLVRHLDQRLDMHDLLRRGWLETYQRFQARPVFDNCDRIISFIGLPQRRAEFVGVFRVLGRNPGRLARLPRGCPRAWWQNGRHFYDLRREPEFADLENRLIIDWGLGALAWHQRARNKIVLEVRPPGFLTAPFSDYLDFTLSFSQLQHLITHADANREWRARLSAVGGVYLILDSLTGRQYVGSASGPRGLWGRWSGYATNGHGGNARLKALVRSGRGYPDAFTFSVLQVVPPSTAKSEVLAMEARFKKKLGSLATGLNEN